MKIHGFADSPTQCVWSDMKRRCLNPNRRGYENYGGRGITVCDRWVSGEDGKGGFECFLEDMGPRPSTAHQIDRRDNDGPYCKGNCRWVRKSAQNYNKRNTFRFVAFGKSMTLKQASDRFDMPMDAIYQRLRRGFIPEDAVTRPLGDKCGERNPASKLVAADVIEIRKQLAAGARCIDIMKAYGISQPLVSQIKRRKAWSHV